MSSETVSEKNNRPAIDTVAVLGAGIIGRSFAIQFAASGMGVNVYEPDAAQRELFRSRIIQSVTDLDEFGLLEQAPEAVLKRVSLVSDLVEATFGVDLVQECAPESLTVKQSIFRELDKLIADDTILASSSSAIPASQFAAELGCAERCLIAHPGNPPTLIRVIELVPAPATSTYSLSRAIDLYEKAGFRTVIVKHEVRGFVFNRLQGALLSEAYCLVRDGVASVEEIDSIVRDGLGLRWSIVGPFETADLNRRGGIVAHAEIMADAYAEMSAEREPCERWTPELVAKVNEQRRELLPLSQWDERARWRDRQLMAALAAKRNSN